MTGFHFIETTTDRTRQLAIASFVWLGLASIGVFLFFFNPALPGNQFFPKCPFRLLTGFQCPGCGSPMLVRVARKGAKAGKAFWGCPRFPDCTGMLPT